MGQGHEAKWPRQDLSALWSPGPTLEQQLRRPRAAPSASTLRRAMSPQDKTGNTGTAQDQDIALPAACLSLPHADTLRWLQPHASVSLTGGTWVPPVPVVMFPCCPLPERSHCIHRGPYPPTCPQACSSIPTAGQGSMTP